MIPEFLYGPAYDAMHRFGVVKAGIPGMQFRQKGLREPLLCDRCEQFLNKEYESPISRVWATYFPEEVSGTAYLLEAVDYSVFKLFHLSILWRASVAQGDEWSAVNLGTRHEEGIREAIRNGHAPDRSSYPILGNLFVGPMTKRPSAGWLMPPCANRLGASRVYTLLYGGCAWHTVVASHTVVAPANPFVLSESGQLGMPVHDITELRDIDIAKQIRFQWKKE